MYYLLFVLLYPLSLLPLPLLYRFGDVAFFFLYYVAGYRKTIVWDNLRHAFPEKEETELHIVCRQFYRHFCDQWVETVKLLSLSRKERNRCCTGNWEVLLQYEKEGRNVCVMLGHFFNWEWANLVCADKVQQLYAGVYLPLTNKAFDRLMQYIRSRSGALLVSMKALKKGLSQLRGKPHILALIADQNPSVPDVATWLPFMHREAPFFRGGGQIAVRSKAAVVFAAIRKEHRGHYTIHFSRFCDDATQETPDTILKAYVSFLETQLKAQPANWLWTHRRWKHRRQ